MARLATYTLNQLLLDFGIMLKDAALLKVTTQGAPNEITVAKLASDSSNSLVGSEVWVWNPPADMTASNPLIVKTSDANGKLTFTEAVGPTAIPAGSLVTLQNIGGKGHPHAMKEQALRFALLEQGAMMHMSASLLTPDSTTSWQEVPAGIDSIYKVVVVDTSTGANIESEISPAYWNDLDVMGRRLYLPFDYTGRYLVFYGRKYLTYPWAGTTDYNAQIDVDPSNLIKDAHIWLLLNHRDDKSAQVVANMYNDKARTRRDLPLPGEVFLN